MEKANSSNCYPAAWNWAYNSLLKGRQFFVVALVFMVISSIYFNEYLVIRAAVRQRRSSPSGPMNTEALGSPDAVFHRVHQLLTTLDPEAQASCPYLYGAGGRCYHCKANEDLIRPWIDGRKPVCLNLLQPNCSVLSFGINHDFSFDEVMEDLGCTVHAFDPTMGVDSYRRSKGIHFHRLGIGPSDTDLGGFPVASLGSIVRRARLQAGVIDYMKLDVETSEWEVLRQQLTAAGDLLRVRQLNIEFHLFQWAPQIAEGDGMKTPGNLRVPYEDAVAFIAVLEALRKAGFGLVSADKNISCQSYAEGCLSYLYDTHWVNKKINGSSFA